MIERLTMNTENMLGVTLREVRGLFADLNDKLTGNNGDGWKKSLALFLRGENPFSKDDYLVHPLDWMKTARGRALVVEDVLHFDIALVSRRKAASCCMCDDGTGLDTLYKIRDFVELLKNLWNVKQVVLHYSKVNPSVITERQIVEIDDFDNNKGLNEVGSNVCRTFPVIRSIGLIGWTFPDSPDRKLPMISSNGLVWGETLANQMTWDEAVAEAKKTDGWRLPTIKELHEVCKDEAPGFYKNDFYWASGEASGQHADCLKPGWPSIAVKSMNGFVRLVRVD